MTHAMWWTEQRYPAEDRLHRVHLMMSPFSKIDPRCRCGMWHDGKVDTMVCVDVWMDAHLQSPVGMTEDGTLITRVNIHP